MITSPVPWNFAHYVLSLFGVSACAFDSYMETWIVGPSCEVVVSVCVLLYTASHPVGTGWCPCMCHGPNHIQYSRTVHKLGLSSLPHNSITWCSGAMDREARELRAAAACVLTLTMGEAHLPELLRAGLPRLLSDQLAEQLAEQPSQQLDDPSTTGLEPLCPAQFHIQLLCMMLLRARACPPDKESELMAAAFQVRAIPNTLYTKPEPQIFSSDYNVIVFGEIPSLSVVDPFALCFLALDVGVLLGSQPEARDYRCAVLAARVRRNRQRRPPTETHRFSLVRLHIDLFVFCYKPGACWQRVLQV